MYGVELPANGITSLKYGKISKNIKVPPVKTEVPPSYTITFKKGEASNISFMLIDKATGLPAKVILPDGSVIMEAVALSITTEQIPSYK